MVVLLFDVCKLHWGVMCKVRNHVKFGGIREELPVSECIHTAVDAGRC